MLRPHQPTLADNFSYIYTLIFTVRGTVVYQLGTCESVIIVSSMGLALLGKYDQQVHSRDRVASHAFEIL